MSDSGGNDWWIAFGAAVRTARQDCGLTQADLAKLLDLTRSAVAKIETGRQYVRADTAAWLAAELGMKVPGWRADRSATLLTQELGRARQALKDALRHAEDACAAAQDAL